MTWACVLVLAGLGPGVLHAAPPAAAEHAVVEPGPDQGAIDWTRGLLIAVGAAPGDIRAPSPDLARVGAERHARAQARERLRARAEALTMGERSVADWAAADRAVAERLAWAVDRALDLDIDYGSDGSVMVTAGLPLEAVRLAVRGVPALPAEAAAAPADGPTAIVVDARKVLRAPALGLELARGNVTHAGPVVFHRHPGRAAADPRVGPRPVRARAEALADGRLVLAGLSPETLKAANSAGALVIVILGKP